MAEENFNILINAVIKEAKFLNSIKSNSSFLYENLRRLNKSIFNEIIEQYKDDSRPVNQLRAILAEKLLQSDSINDNVVDELKSKISVKFDKDVFKSRRS